MLKSVGELSVGEIHESGTPGLLLDEEAVMARVIWHLLCMEEEKASTDLYFHDTHCCVAELHGSGLLGEAGGRSLLPSPSDRDELEPHEAVFPQFPHFCVFWPGRFVLSKLPVPCRVRQQVSRPAVLGDLRTCAQSVPNPRGSGRFFDTCMDG